MTNPLDLVRESVAKTISARPGSDELGKVDFARDEPGRVFLAGLGQLETFKANGRAGIIVAPRLALMIRS